VEFSEEHRRYHSFQEFFMMQLSLGAVSLIFLSATAYAAEPDPVMMVPKIIEAAGGKDKLLTQFRIKERLAVSADPLAKGNERVSVLVPPTHWWLGKRERVAQDKEPATFLVWAWTLGILVEPKTKLAAIPGIMEGDNPAYGMRVSETVEPTMDMYFDQKTNRLVRIDWRGDSHKFSDWKETNGIGYPARCIGLKKSTGKQWYQTEILELEPLKDLPEGLKR